MCLCTVFIVWLCTCCSPNSHLILCVSVRVCVCVPCVMTGVCGGPSKVRIFSFQVGISSENQQLKAIATNSGGRTTRCLSVMY